MNSIDTEMNSLPPGLHPGGAWLPAIRREVHAALATEAYAQVLKPPPRFLVLLLKPWLRFRLPRQAD